MADIKRQALQIHEEVAELFAEMDNNEAGLMIKALCMYHFHNDPEWLKEKSLRLTFKLLRGRVDRDAAAYADKCAKNRDNIAKRWNGEVKNDIRPNTTVYERIPLDTKNTNPKPNPKVTIVTKESTRARENFYPEYLTGELLKEFEEFLSVYEATYDKRPHPGQIAEILVDLTRIPDERRLESVKQSKKYAQKTIHDYTKFKKPNGSGNREQEPRQQGGFGI